MTPRSVVITSGVRTPIGVFGGALAGHPPTQLAALCVTEALRRADLPGERVEHVVFGNVIVTEPRDAYLARVAGIEGRICCMPGASASAWATWTWWTT